MKAYKKRAMSSWRKGKSYKRQSNRDERAFAKNEILKMEKISSDIERMEFRSDIFKEETERVFINNHYDDYNFLDKTSKIKRPKKVTLKQLVSKKEFLEKKISSYSNSDFLGTWKFKIIERMKKQVEDIDKKINELSNNKQFS